MTSLAKARLQQERKSWRKDHPFGFIARPATMEDGSVNLMRWECKIPGKDGTDWNGGLYPVTMDFSEDYPVKPPKVKFPKGFFHVNIYPSGTVCLSILNEEENWQPGISIKEILLGIQELLDTPNPASPAQTDPYHLFIRNRAEYNRRVKQQVSLYPHVV